MTTIQTIHQYRCELNQGPSEVNLKTPIMHQDALGDVFRVSVWRGNKTVDLTGMTVRGYLYFASTRQTLLLEGNITEGCACVTLTSECYAIPGYASLVVQVQDSDIRHSLLKVNMCITRTGSESVIDPGDILPTLPELLGQIAAMEQATAEAREAAAAADAAREGIQGDLAALSEENKNISNVLFDKTSKLVIHKHESTWTSGYYVNEKGQTLTNASYSYSQRIPVQAGESIDLYRSDGSARILQWPRLCCYVGDTADASKGGSYVQTPFIVPEGVTAIVVSLTGDAAFNPYFEVTRHEETEQIANRIYASKGLVSDRFALAAGETYSGLEYHDMLGYRICFNGKLTGLSGKIKVAHGVSSAYSGAIEIDSANIYQYIGTAAEPNRTQPHGLTIKDYVSITIDAGYTSEAHITIATNGGIYKWTTPFWRGYVGALSVYSSSDALTDCVLSYACDGLNKPIWLFGDSYFAWTYPERWTHYLMDSGHKNYLLNGYPGRSSAAAIEALKNDLQLGAVPAKIIWCLGMNDLENGSMNQAWLAGVEYLMALCEEKHIELILSTTPCTPTRSNTIKNEYVRNSGYRYIDFAKAVNGEAEGSAWYDGMLASDNVHPEAQGAIALFAEAIAAVPELLND